MSFNPLLLMHRTLEAAVRWCAAMQLELMQTEWPEALLKWPDCAPEVDHTTGALLYRGLRVRMGMAFGRAQHRKPLNTGEQSLFHGFIPPVPSHKCCVKPCSACQHSDCVGLYM